MNNPKYEDWERYQEYKARTQLKVQFLENYQGPAHTFEPAKRGDAGIDLYADDNYIIPVGGTTLVSTGVALAIPKGHEGQIRPKSGLAYNEGLTVLNTPGTIDEGYRGEIKVLLHNSHSLDTYVLNDTISELNYSHSVNTIPSPVTVLQTLSSALDKYTTYIHRGQKIAQLVVAKYARPDVIVVQDLDQTERGAGGFGSTGT